MRSGWRPSQSAQSAGRKAKATVLHVADAGGVGRIPWKIFVTPLRDRPSGAALNEPVATGCEDLEHRQKEARAGAPRPDQRLAGLPALGATERASAFDACVWLYGRNE